MKNVAVTLSVLILIGNPAAGNPASGTERTAKDDLGECEDKLRWHGLSKKHQFVVIEYAQAEATAGSVRDVTPEDRVFREIIPLDSSLSLLSSSLRSALGDTRRDDDHEELPPEDEGEDEWTSRGEYKCHDLVAFPFYFSDHCSEHEVIGGSCDTHEEAEVREYPATAVARRAVDILGRLRSVIGM